MIFSLICSLPRIFSLCVPFFSFILILLSSFRSASVQPNMRTELHAYAFPLKVYAMYIWSVVFDRRIMLVELLLPNIKWTPIKCSVWMLCASVGCMFSIRCNFPMLHLTLNWRMEKERHNKKKTKNYRRGRCEEQRKIEKDCPKPMKLQNAIKRTISIHLCAWRFFGGCARIYTASLSIVI